MSMFGNRGRGGRAQAFMFGLPAVVVSIVGVVLLGMAEFGATKDLEEHYLFQAEKSTKEKQRLVGELRRDLRMLKVSQGSNIARGEDLIPKDDPRRIDLESNRKKETVYLEKLISLNTEEPEYKFKLAMACLEKEETRGRGLAMMRTISPADEPGHIEGHIFLSNYYLNSRTSNQSEALRNVGLALDHVELCLRRDKTNVRALQIKAKLLYLKRQYADAYVVFEELFEKDPSYFQALVDLNNKLDRQDRNIKIVSRAIDLFDKTLRDQEELTDAKRVRVFQELTKCYVAKKDFETIEKRLLAEIELQSSSVDDAGKRVWAEHLLSSVYSSWLQMFPSDASNFNNILMLLRKAHIYNPKNDYVLRRLARLGDHPNQEVAAAARAIYDPSLQTDAPALVLNELGTQALGRSEYQEALRYFELARKKMPRAPEVLNNLSYTYLVGDTPNPKRALKLVDEALKYLPKTPDNERYRTHFHDTRGKALMQLGQVSEAAAEFEFALRSRPNNEGILESLIKCYRANEMDPAPYERHLTTVREKKNSVQNANSSDDE